MKEQMINIGDLLEGSWKIAERIQINKDYSRYKLVNIYAPKRVQTISETELRNIINGKASLGKFLHNKISKERGSKKYDCFKGDGTKW